ncbi:MAG TPA: hypothetical protein VGM19_02275 [Armatimonadota bacterium]|jgi:hypothetical protein
MKSSDLPLSPLFFRVLFHPYIRAFAVVAALVGVYLGLLRAGYPWWLNTPAALLGGFATLWIWVLLSYAYQKHTYPLRALQAKRRRQSQPRE